MGRADINMEITQKPDIPLMNCSSAIDKEKHLRICLQQDVESDQTTGFEKFFLINNSAPEVDYNEIDTSAELMGRKISAPFVILPMTGGTELSGRVNRNLAEAAQEMGVAMAVGSQRLGIEDPSLVGSFQIRDIAPDVPLIANLGAIYLNYDYGLDECERAVEMIDADALSLYLNPMQKLFQGSREIYFKNLIDKIAHVCEHLSVPVIVKEVGFGLSSDIALSLKEAGVSLLDIAGAGGTSWVKVTRYLNNNHLTESVSEFDGWGIPTADALVAVKDAVEDIPIIASGGIRSGVDIAKALALGADFAGMALPLLSSAMESSNAVKKKIQSVKEDLRFAMFGCDTANLGQLKSRTIIKSKMDSCDEQFCLFQEVMCGRDRDTDP